MAPMAAESVAADEDGLGARGRMGANPFMDFGGLNRELVRWQSGGAVMDNL